MLTEAALDELFERFGVPRLGRDLVRHIRVSEPVRRVRGGRGNVISIYPSRKMGRSIQAESHTCELVGILQKEHDEGVFEFWDQPTKFKLSWKSATGRGTGALHTPDFLEISDQGFIFEEWKTEVELIELAQEQPNKYTRDPDGKWRFLPAERAAEALGLSYRVRSSGDINWHAHSNLTYLADYLADGVPDPTEAAQGLISDVLAQEGRIRLSELISQCDGHVDSILTMIARGDLASDLMWSRLSDPYNFFVFSCPAAARAHAIQREARCKSSTLKVTAIDQGSMIDWDGARHLVLNLGSTQVLLRPDTGKPVSLGRLEFDRLVQDAAIVCVDLPEDENEEAISKAIREASKQDLEEANARYERIREFLDGTRDKDVVISSTAYRWVKNYKKLQATHGNGYLGLIPKARLGNRTERYPESVREFAESVIEAHHLNDRAESVTTTYGAYKLKSKAAGLLTLSRKAFVRILKSIPLEELVRRRQGNRAAYQVQQELWHMEWTSPRHGSRPFEYAHLDHTELDIEIVDRNERNIGRPWLTLMIDTYTRKIIAWIITFSPPSHRSCMLIIRKCIKKHRRMPDWVVTDNGSEFRSTYYQTLLARLKVGPKYRPAGKARFGTVCERIFGVVNAQFVHNLRGNTKLMVKPRAVSSSFNPQQTAIWTLEALGESLEHYIESVYHENVHSSLMMSPREAEIQGWIASGKRTFKTIAYDRDLYILTCPAPPREKATVNYQKGVRLFGRRYRSDEFRHEHHGKRFHVRYDPFNAGIVFLFLDTGWAECRSDHYKAYAGLPVSEVERLSAEYHASLSASQKHLVSNADRVANFIQRQRGREGDLVKIRSTESVEVNLGITQLESSPLPSSAPNERKGVEREEKTIPNEQKPESRPRRLLNTFQL